MESGAAAGPVCPQAAVGAAPGPGGGRFPFPYAPYRIQERFMAALYGALEAGRVGIFESPTGTVRQRGGTAGRRQPGGDSPPGGEGGWWPGQGAGAGPESH